MDSLPKGKIHATGCGYAWKRRYLTFKVPDLYQRVSYLRNSPGGSIWFMNDFEKIYDFRNLYQAHKKARLGKRGNREVIEFEMNLALNLTQLSDSIKNKTYRTHGYYSFTIHDPKDRTIHALHYVDRVVQHCICDEVLAPILEKKLIYDNAACRIGKGTHFAQRRLSGFMRKYFKENDFRTDGYFLRCDIRKFFDSVDHEVLKTKITHAIKDSDILEILFEIIDSYETLPGKGLPLGNQTSQWFAIYYLDGFDRLIKEQMKIRYYTRYMDDCVLLHRNKEYLQQCRKELEKYLKNELKLEFNEKTQIMPMQNGVQYLGFHFYLTDTGKVIRKVKQATKYKYKRKTKYMQKTYKEGKMNYEDIRQVICSYNAHLSHGHTYQLRKAILSDFVLNKGGE